MQECEKRRRRNEDLELRGLDCRRAAEAINRRPTAKRRWCFRVAGRS
jgi:hypothetical protein